jgi:subtilisin family serine protease
VVAVLDTGAGPHPWLPDTIVHRDPTVDGTASGHPIGLTDPATDPEGADAVGDQLLGELGSDSGHGTFIAGLIRQLCPEADVLAVRIMHNDGMVTESDMLHSLHALHIRQAIAQRDDRPELLIDVVSMSFGYYHEQPEDSKFDHVLLAPLRALAGRGVAVVAAAGNDSTYRCMYPAAFTPWAHGLVTVPHHTQVPLISVGALNPDVSTIALFSNAGEWVACHRRGAALVSTFPITMDGSMEASERVVVAGDGVRSTIDPDNFSSGFGIWSGTSFSAPILAGQLAASMLADGPMPADHIGCVERAWSAVSAQVPGLVRPT